MACKSNIKTLGAAGSELFVSSIGPAHVHRQHRLTAYASGLRDTVLAEKMSVDILRSYNDDNI